MASKNGTDAGYKMMILSTPPEKFRAFEAQVLSLSR
jgi:hypothetical protein